jgi:hypothetical protein
MADASRRRNAGLRAVLSKLVLSEAKPVAQPLDSSVGYTLWSVDGASQSDDGGDQPDQR